MPPVQSISGNTPIQAARPNILKSSLKARGSFLGRTVQWIKGKLKTAKNLPSIIRQFRTAQPTQTSQTLAQRRAQLLNMKLTAHPRTDEMFNYATLAHKTEQFEQKSIHMRASLNLAKQNFPSSLSVHPPQNILAQNPGILGRLEDGIAHLNDQQRTLDDLRIDLQDLKGTKESHTEEELVNISKLARDTKRTKGDMISLRSLLKIHLANASE